MMMNWKVVLIFAFVLSPGSQVLSQVYELEIVVNNEEGQPLELATVLVQPGNTGGVTDASGSLLLTLTGGEYEIKTNFLGYREETNRIKLQNDTVVIVSLFATATGLQTIEVTDTDASDILSRPILGVQRLTRKQLDELPAVMGEADILKGLQLLPGVGSAGEASNGISVRGGSIDQNLVLLDHVPIFNPTHLFGLFSVFPPDGIRSADLYQGNIPARFGGRVASVLDVRMRSPSAVKPVITGGIGLVSSRLSFESPVVKDRLYILSAVRAGFNDFWFDLVDRLKDTRANFGDAAIKLRWHPAERHILHLTGFYSRDNYQIDLISQFAGFTSDKNIYDYRTLNLTLDWHFVLNERTYLQTVLTRADYEPRIRLPELVTENEALFKSNILHHALTSVLHFKTNDRLLITGGLQLIRYTNRPGELDPGGSTMVNDIVLPKEAAYESGLFVEAEWELDEYISVSAGLRYGHYFQIGPTTVRKYSNLDFLTDDEVTGEEHYKKGEVIKTYGGLEPRIGFRWSVDEKVSFKAAYARNKQYLQNIFNATTPLPTSRWKTSDQHIRPQKSQLFSAGVFYRINEEFEFGLESYYRITNDILEYKPGAAFFLKKFVETELLQGESRAYGLEFSFRKTAGKNTGWLNYTYARAFNRVAGEEFTNSINDGDWYPNNFDRPHTINIIYTLDGGKHHALSLNFTLTSGRPYTVPNGNVELDDVIIPIFFERNNGRIPTYHRLDLSWKITNPSMKERRWVGEWIFTVYNIYGRKNAYNIYYGPRMGGYGNIFKDSRLGSYRISIFAAPIVSLTYQFRFS